MQVKFYLLIRSCFYNRAGYCFLHKRSSTNHICLFEDGYYVSLYYKTSGLIFNKVHS
ncbi:hypothetical protein DsansV1_C04g0036931 [Dioscorea sansibarensis]